MPKAAEAALKKEAKKKFPNDKKRQERYIYGALENMKKKGHGKSK